MQVQSVATYTAFGAGFDFIADGLAVVQAGGYVRLYLASRVDTRIVSLTLSEGQPAAAPQPGNPVIGTGAGADFAVQSTATLDRVYVFSSHLGPLRHASIGPSGLPGLTNATNTDQGYLNGVTCMELVEMGPTDIAAIAQRNMPGLRLFSITDQGQITLLSTLTDGPKSYLAEVSDLAAMQIGGRNFLMTASARENGVTLFEIAANGRASFVDALGADHGLPVAGPAALQTASVGGTQFVVLASTLSNSLTVLRVNAMGVMFVADHLIDDRNTRFDAVAALDLFTHAGRVFVVAAGTDAGFSLLELLPDGQLSHILSRALETGAGIAQVTGIETAVYGGTAAILLTDAGGARVYHFAVSLAQIGGLIVATGGTATGSALDDRIMGSAAPDTLSGGAGDDFVHDGGGNDLLFGGAGADVFLMSRDGSPDRIGDFQDGLDRIDLSDWGRLYSVADLTITSTATGAVVSYGNESLTITASGSLTLGNDDFLF